MGTQSQCFTGGKPLRDTESRWAPSLGLEASLAVASHVHRLRDDGIQVPLQPQQCLQGTRQAHRIHSCKSPLSGTWYKFYALRATWILHIESHKPSSGFSCECVGACSGLKTWRIQISAARSSEEYLPPKRVWAPGTTLTAKRNRC